MRKLVTAGVAALTVVGGMAAGAAVGSPDVASAQEETAPAVEASPADAGRESLAEVLGNLVEDGTLTQTQADAVEEAIRTRVGPRSPRFRHAAHHGIEAAAGAIGIGPGDLVEQLRAGQTMAQVAQANGVDEQHVVDALVAEANEHIDRALESDRIDEERAAELRERAVERAESIVAGDYPEREGAGRFGPRAERRPGG